MEQQIEGCVWDGTTNRAPLSKTVNINFHSNKGFLQRLSTVFLILQYSSCLWFFPYCVHIRFLLPVGANFTFPSHLTHGYAVEQLVEALHYKTKD